MIAPLTRHTLFAGEFRHALDPKNRITVPSCWRGDGGEKLFLIPDQTKSFIIAMPTEVFEGVPAQVAASGMSMPEQRIFLRQFSSRARANVPDKQGRLLVPEEHLRQTGLSGDVVLVGAQDRFEIWNPQKWDRFNEVNDDLYRRVADSAGL